MLKFYNHIFAYYFNNINGSDPRDSSIYILGAIHVLHLGVIAGLIKFFTGTSILSFPGPPYYALFFHITWMFALTKYFSKERSEVLLLSFNEKSGGVQMTWAVTSVACIITPIILFLFLFAKG